MDDRFNKVDERFDKIDSRFDKLDERFDSLEMALARFGSRSGKSIAMIFSAKP